MRRPLVLLLLAALLLGCDGGGKGGGDDGGAPAQPGGGGTPPPPPTSGTTTDQPTVPNSATPPVGVTWHVGITENVSRAAMQNVYATLVAANNALWKVSEGQVRVDRIRFFDNVGPGINTTMFMFNPGAIDTSNLDIVVWPSFMWNVPAAGAVGEQQGRNNRIMIVPDNVPTFVALHESSHLLFQLTWAVGGLLVDEYNDGVQDQACVMESENSPQRWCSERNHAAQSSQPHSCWRQILTDYPAFAHAGQDTAPDLPPAPTAEYNDTP
ncbi:MAG: hypothetical protein ACYTEZ_12805 [Planctomycetota bacterium]|jgi:hypothetical protein